MRIATGTTPGHSWPALLALAVCITAWLSDCVTADDRQFQKSVNRAIDRGRDWLLHEYRQDGFPLRGYPMGTEAFCLYALINAGLDPNDPLVERKFRRLASQPLEKTYGVALHMMALDARHRARAAAKGIDKPGPIRGGGRRRMQQCLDWLLRTKIGGSGVWGYGPGMKPLIANPKFENPGYDHSNTQFAVLGLEIALRNGLHVPDHVFREIGNSLVKSQARDGRSVRPMVRFRPRRGKGAREIEIKPTRAGSWGYYGKVPNRPKPTPEHSTLSMTAAGLSNLFIVRTVLGRRGAVDKSIDEAIRAGLVWVTRKYSSLNSLRVRSRGIFHDYFYTIYTIEKVGDLGHVIRFGQNDWYRLEARFLIRSQRSTGQWGKKRTDSHISTAFALLFLRRATAPAPVDLEKLLRPPYMVDDPGKKASNDQDDPKARDRVYVGSLEGFVSARELFRFLATEREASELSVARQVVAAYPPLSRPELIPHLLRLLGPHDAVATFGTRTLKKITDLRRVDEEDCKRWKSRWETVREIGHGRDRSRLGPVLEILRRPRKESAVLQETALWALGRIEAKEAIGELVAVLDDVPSSVRESFHRTLCQLSGRTSEFSKLRWRDLVGEWKSWAERHAAVARSDPARRKSREKQLDLAPHLNALDRTGSSQQETRDAADELIAAGDRAIPSILERMKRPDYSYHLVEVLEEITGERLGPARDPWAEWWAKRQAKKDR